MNDYLIDSVLLTLRCTIIFLPTCVVLCRYTRAPSVMTWCRQATAHEDRSVLLRMLNVCSLHISWICKC